MTSMKIDTVVGSLDWTSGPVKNVAKTPLVGGQWRSAGDGKYNMVVTENTLAPSIPTGGSMEPIFG